MRYKQAVNNYITLMFNKQLIFKYKYLNNNANDSKTRVHRACTAVYTGRKHGRVHVYTTVYTARTRPRPAYTCARPCYVLLDRVHGRILAVYTTVYTTMYTARTRVQSRVHGSVYTTLPLPCVHHTAVYTGRVHCHQWTRPVYTGRKEVYTAYVHGRIHGRVQAVDGR